MIRIIFVDDEPNILDGLRRMLRDMRSQWQMAFAGSGAEALETLATGPYDIIVSDMRMPGMDGAALLEQVRQLYPHMSRIILSGHSEKTAILKSVRLAHQFLAKPCDPEQIKKAIGQTSCMRGLFRNDRLAGLVARIEALPPMPHYYSKLLDALESEDSTIKLIGDLIARDMGLSTTVLKLVNSAFFGLPHRVSYPAQAVGLLGLEIIKGLVLTQGLFKVFDAKQAPGMSFDELWRHCLMVGGYAKNIARLEEAGREMEDNAFIAGILHDVGKLVLTTAMPREYAGVIAKVREENRLAHEVEQEILGATHGEAGAYLLGLWGADQDVVTAIAVHERPGQAPFPLGPKARLLALSVHAANVYEHEFRVIHPQYALPQLDYHFLAQQQVLTREYEWRPACQALLKNEDGDESNEA